MCFISDKVDGNRARTNSFVRQEFTKKLTTILKETSFDNTEKEILYRLFNNYMNNITPEKNEIVSRYLALLDGQGYEIFSLNDLLQEIDNYRTSVLPIKFTKINGLPNTTPNLAEYRKSRKRILKNLLEKTDSKLPRAVTNTKVVLN